MNIKTSTPINPGTDGLDDSAPLGELRAKGHFDDSQGNSSSGEDEVADRGRSNAEAARRRVELREVQAERDALRGRIEAMQRTEVERLAGVQLAVAGDIFEVAHVELTDLLDDDGSVDPQAVDNAVRSLLAARPGLGAVPPRPGGGVPSHGLGYRRSTADSGPTWFDVVTRGGSK